MINLFNSPHLLVTSRLPFLGEISNSNNLVITLAIEAVVVAILYFLMFYLSHKSRLTETDSASSDRVPTEYVRFT